MTDYLSHIEQLLAEATPGPWFTSNNDTVVSSKLGMWISVPQGMHTAQLIAEIPTALRRLLDAHKVMREALESLDGCMLHLHNLESCACRKNIRQALSACDEILTGKG